MADYLLLYTGRGEMPEGPEGMTAFMEAWNAWAAGLGGALKDEGNPFGGSKAIDASGAVSDSSPFDATGYSIITADSIDAAVEMSKGNPVLGMGTSVNVFETFFMSWEGSEAK